MVCFSDLSCCAVGFESGGRLGAGYHAANDRHGQQNYRVPWRVLSAFIDPVVTDNIDPLPTTSFSVGGASSSDPRSYPFGQTSVLITACDVFTNCANTSVVIDIVDTQGPLVNAGPDRVEQCTGPAGTAVTLANPSVTDVCFGTATFFNNNAPALYPLGQTIVTVTGADPQGNTRNDTVKVTIQDLAPRWSMRVLTFW
ncbi:MAG: hypothetical protein R3C68_08055 [Myxococcota bacterium]